MKIVLHAFGDKLKGVMEIPEDTGHIFRLALTQPIQVFNDGKSEFPLMSSSINKIAEFQWTGKLYSSKDHEYDGAYIYQLTDIK